MKTALLLAMVASLSVFACASEDEGGNKIGFVGDENHDDENGNDTNTTGLRIENLVATVERMYQCPAGGVEPFDSGNESGCGCDTTGYTCNWDYDAGGQCLCDADCIEARPQIDCADYDLTFVVRNDDPRRIDRMSAIKVTINSVEQAVAGLNCGEYDWALAPGARSQIHQVGFDYDRRSSVRHATPQLSYPCLTQDYVITGDTMSNRLGKPIRPASSTGTALLEVSGLYEDGAPWTIKATAGF